MKNIFTSLKILTVFIFLAACSVTNAQTNTWTLVNGADTSLPAVYGTQGHLAIANTPGSRAFSATWTDSLNNLWLFGGYNGGQYMGDLWKYSIDSNEWAWINGSKLSSPTGHYGVKGVPSAANQPAGRTGSIGWADSSGNLWLFGGALSHYLNDVWKYTIDSSQWTWMHGDSTQNPPAVYGTKGVADSANTPGGRDVSTGWVGKNGLLWMFGGIGYDNSPSYGAFNDLWSYNTATSQWTWVSGDSVVNPAASYGTLGKPSGANTPGAREPAGNWVDAAGNLWLFGGQDDIGDSFNDLWKYDVTSNEWTWVNGSSSPAQNGTYGTLGKPAAANNPGARAYSAYWTDVNGDFWLLGGSGFDSSYFRIGALNDLWKYNINSNQWTWMGGSAKINPPDVKGAPYRRQGANCWTDTSGVFWLYGGQTTAGTVNSLWRYAADSAAASITATTNPVTSSSLIVYPNPGNGNFTVDLPEAAQVSVYGTLGELIVTQNLPKGKQPLNLSAKPAGVYYLKTNSNNGQQAVKLVVE